METKDMELEVIRTDTEKQDANAVDGFISSLIEEPEHNHFTKWSVTFIIMAMVGHLINIGTDVATTKLLSDEGNQVWFILTLIITVLPRVITNAISVHWFWQDDHKCHYPAHFASVTYKKSTMYTWAIRIVSHVLLLGPFFRYIDLLIYGFKAKTMSANKPSPHLKKCADYYTRYVFEDRDSSLLALIESFLGDALQLVLQIYILLTRPSDEYNTLTSAVQIASIASSLWAIASSMTNYHLALRFSVADKRNLSPMGRILQFFWRLGTVSSRVFTLALFASEFKIWAFSIVGTHWLIMWIWIMCQNTSMCENDNGKSSCLTEKLFNAVMAGVLITCYVNVKEGATRIKSFIYYLLILTQNTIMLTIWYLYSDQSTWYHLPAIIATSTSFFAGIFFMLIYYRCFHPNGKMPNSKHIADLC